MRFDPAADEVYPQAPFSTIREEELAARSRTTSRRRLRLSRLSRGMKAIDEDESISARGSSSRQSRSTRQSHQSRSSRQSRQRSERSGSPPGSGRGGYASGGGYAGSGRSQRSRRSVLQSTSGVPLIPLSALPLSFDRLDAIEVRQTLT